MSRTAPRAAKHAAMMAQLEAEQPTQYVPCPVCGQILTIHALTLRIECGDHVVLVCAAHEDEP